MQLISRGEIQYAGVEDKTPKMLKAMVVAMPSLFAPDPVMILGPDGRDAPLNEGVDLMAEATAATPDYFA